MKNKDKLTANLIYVSISAFASFLVVFLFDIHHGFYTWPMTLKFLFENKYPYVIFVSIGTIIGFVLIQLFLIGLMKEIGNNKE